MIQQLEKLNHVLFTVVLTLLIVTLIQDATEAKFDPGDVGAPRRSQSSGVR